MKYLIMTDLEGVAGVDSFRQTRIHDNNDPIKAAAMKQLARETNACVEGIRSVDSEAEVDVIDGHGYGGLFPDDLIGCRYIRYAKFPHETMTKYAALFFVGQHAMAGTIDAPLCHSYSSLTVQYYRLNDVYIGEFAAFSTWAGLNGVPTVFLAGDDKAALEAQMFIPSIVTAVTKLGKGIEAAEHVPPDEACRIIREKAANAAGKRDEIAPYTRFQSPYTFEARFYEPFDRSRWEGREDVSFVDERTYRIETTDYRSLPFF